jgi:hypothetical protein
MPEIVAGLQPFPFDLPPDFLARLGYERAVGTRIPITDELRDQLCREYGAERLAAFEASAVAPGSSITGGSWTWSTGPRSTAGWSSTRSTWAAPRSPPGTR